MDGGEPQAAIAWLLSKPGVTAPIIGAIKLPQLDDAIESVDLELSSEEIQTPEAPLRRAPGEGARCPAQQVVLRL